MDRPNECKWCKSGVRLNGQFLTFKCWTILLSHAWSQSPECKLGVAESRIQRAIEAIRAANRCYLHPDKAVFIPDKTGDLTQACVLDDVAAILEGKSDGQTE